MGQFYSEIYLAKDAGKHVGLLVVAFLCVIVVGYFLFRITTTNKKLNWTILGLMLIIFAVVAITWIRLVPNEQISDFGNFWLSAPGVLKGEKLFQSDNDYFAKYAYQSGFMVYILAIIKIFGYKVAAMQGMNVVFQVLILLVTYLLVVQIFDNIKMARLAVFLLMIDLDWFALNSQADNQYLGTLFYLLTFYLITKDKLWAYILAGITLTIGCLVRPIGPVIILGIAVFAIIYLMFDKNKFDYKRFSKIVLTLVIYFVLFALAGWGIKASGLNEYGLSNRDTEWKFVTGLNYASDGTYTPDMDKYLEPDKPRAEVRKNEKVIVKKQINYLNENNKWLDLFVTKLKGLWSQRTMATDAAGFSDHHSDRASELVNYLAYIGSIILIVFSWIGSIGLFKTNFTKYLYVLLLPMMAFAAAQLLIEVQGRYRIEFLPILAILASVGLFKVCEWLKQLFDKRIGA